MDSSGFLRADQKMKSYETSGHALKSSLLIKERRPSCDPRWTFGPREIITRRPALRNVLEVSEKKGSTDQAKRFGHKLQRRNPVCVRYGSAPISISRHWSVSVPES